MNEQPTPRAVEGTLGESATPHLSADLCVDMLHGLISREEQSAAVWHLACCPACEELFRRCVRNRERFRARRPAGLAPGGLIAWARANQAKGAVGKRKTTGGYPHLFMKLVASVQPRRARYAFLGSLAAIAAVVLLIALPRTNTPPGLWDHLPPVANDVRLRSDVATNSKAALAEGLSAYEREAYDVAVQRLEQVKADGELETIRCIYLGSALAHRGRYREAVAVLRPLPLRELPDPWSSQATWTLYYAFRQRGMRAAADSLLVAVAREPGPDGDRARRMLAGGERR